MDPFHTDVQVLADQHFCMDTGCSLEDLLEAIDDRDEWRERRRQGNLC